MEQKIEKDQISSEPSAAGGLEGEAKLAFRNRTMSNSFSLKKTASNKKTVSITNAAQPQSALRSLRTSLDQRGDKNGFPNLDFDLNSPDKLESSMKDESFPESRASIDSRISPEQQLKLTKRNTDVSSPSDKGEDSKKSDDSVGLAGVSFKDLLLSKKKVQLKSTKKSDVKVNPTADKEQTEKKNEDKEAAVPKIKEVGIGKSVFAKKLGEKQANLVAVNKIDIKVLPSQEESGKEANNEKKTEVAEIGTETLIKSPVLKPRNSPLAQVFGKKEERPVSVGGIVMKALPRMEQGQNELDSKLLRPNLLLQQLGNGNKLEKSPRFLMPNQNHIEPIHSGSPTPQRSPAGLKEYLNQKISESERFKGQISSPQPSKNEGTLKAKLMAKLGELNRKSSGSISGSSTDILVIPPWKEQNIQPAENKLNLEETHQKGEQKEKPSIEIIKAPESLLLKVPIRETNTTQELKTQIDERTPTVKLTESNEAKTDALSTTEKLTDSATPLIPTLLDETKSNGIPVLEAINSKITHPEDKLVDAQTLPKEENSGPKSDGAKEPQQPAPQSSDSTQQDPNEPILSPEKPFDKKYEETSAETKESPQISAVDPKGVLPTRFTRARRNSNPISVLKTLAKFDDVTKKAEESLAHSNPSEPSEPSSTKSSSRSKLVIKPVSTRVTFSDVPSVSTIADSVTSSKNNLNDDITFPISENVQDELTVSKENSNGSEIKSALIKESGKGKDLSA